MQNSKRFQGAGSEEAEGLEYQSRPMAGKLGNTDDKGRK